MSTSPSLLLPSVYHTALESVADSLHPFRAPSFRSRTDSDRGSYIHSMIELGHLPRTVPPNRRDSSIMLERYVAEEDASLSTGIRDEVPTIISEQSPKSSTLPTASGNPCGSRPNSPIIRADMLRDCFIQDPAYPIQLRDAVENTARALNTRNRNRESYGLMALYEQSFKDPGSAEQLDALLRNKATERQIIDFRTYVDRVNGLIDLPPLATRPGRSAEKSVRGKRKRQIERDTSTASLFHECAPSPRVPVAASTEATKTTFPPCPTLFEQCESLHNLADMVGALEEQELKEQELAAPEAQRPHKKRRRRSREKRRVETAPPESPELEVRSVSAEPEAQKTDNVLRSEPVDPLHASETAEFELALPNPRQERLNPPPLEHHEVHPEQSSILSINRQPRRRMRKSRMFSGANGPVYSEILWETPNSRSSRARG